MGEHASSNVAELYGGEFSAWTGISTDEFVQVSFERKFLRVILEASR